MLHCNSSFLLCKAKCNYIIAQIVLLKTQPASKQDRTSHNISNHKNATFIRYGTDFATFKSKQMEVQYLKTDISLVKHTHGYRTIVSPHKFIQATSVTVSSCTFSCAHLFSL